MRRLATLFAVLCLLSACDTTAPLRKLRQAKPEGDAYHRYLATLYQAYAEQEEEHYDWWSSKYFADKGLLAAYGKKVMPERPEQWNIAPAFLAPLKDAREKLLRAMDAGAAQSNPEAAAKAMAYYDCWVEQQEEEWKLDKIESCRDGFFEALNVLTAPPPAPEPEPAPEPAPAQATSSILYFPFDSEALEDTGAEVLRQLVAYILAAGDIDVVINGHADRAGSDSYNMALSEKRAAFIRSELIAAGVPESRIQYFAFGESDPQIPTEDGVKEPANRRVEIFIE